MFVQSFTSILNFFFEEELSRETNLNYQSVEQSYTRASDVLRNAEHQSVTMPDEHGNPVNVTVLLKALPKKSQGIPDIDKKITFTLYTRYG